MKPWLFISDLHLSAERPDIVSLFLRFVDEVAAGAERLYILGDLFEYWIGDDGPQQGLAPALAALKSLSDAGVDVYFMAGNRDFLVGDGLARQCGFTRLDDPHVADFHGTALLLMHGDSLCIDDVEYQKFRAMVRDPEWQRDFLARPVAERDSIARMMREKSKEQTSLKDEFIMDVNEDSVRDAFAVHKVRLMIHGHTHRPAIHHPVIDGREATRIVLQDWYHTGGYLSLNGPVTDDTQFRLQQV